jgi:phage baseplate assembly protein W
MALKNPSNQINEIIYSDLDFFFNIHPVTMDVPMLKNVASIKRSIRNLVLTNRYEKFFKPTIFSGVLAGLFENFDPILVNQLKDKIKEVLQVEPRAIINDVLISDYEELDRNGINITIIFKPINRIRVETVDVFLERVR